MLFTRSKGSPLFVLTEHHKGGVVAGRKGLFIPNHDIWLIHHIPAIGYLGSNKVQYLIRNLIISTALVSVGISLVLWRTICFQNFYFCEMFWNKFWPYVNVTHTWERLAGEMAQLLRESTYCSCRGPRFSSLNPHGSYSPSSRKSNTFFWPLWVPAMQIVHR